MKYVQHSIAIAVAVLAFSNNAMTAQAGGFDHIDRLAVQLQEQAQTLTTELRAHYRRSVEFPHLIADATELYRAAEHLHEVVHHEGASRHFAADLQRLDRSYHHLTETVAEIDHHVLYCRDPRCRHHHHGTKHVRAVLARMDATLHHLRDDVDKIVGRNRHAAGIHRASAYDYGRFVGHRQYSSGIGYGRGYGRGYGNSYGNRYGNGYRQPGYSSHGNRATGIAFGGNGFSGRLGF